MELHSRGRGVREEMLLIPPAFKWRSASGADQVVPDIVSYALVGFLSSGISVRRHSPK